MRFTSTARAPLLIAFLVTLLATWLRFYRIDHQSYWNDEGNSLGLAGRAVATIVGSAAADIHPPGYYLALKAWAAGMGTSELALRGFSALAGVVLVALLYRLGKHYFGPGAGVAAALLGALNPFLVYYGQEARMYALLATLSAASFLLFSLWLRSSRPPAPSFGHLGYGLAYVLVTAAALYTHYAFGFVLIAQNVAALGGLLAHGRARPSPNASRLTKHVSTSSTGRAIPLWLPRLTAWFGWQGLALMLYLPWVPVAVRQLSTWPAERGAPPLGTAALELGRYLAFGRTLPADTPTALAGLAGAVALLVFGLRQRGQTITPLLWLLVPAALTLGFGLLTEAFSKFLIVAAPALCLLVGQGLAAVPRRNGRTPTGAGSAVAFRHTARHGAHKGTPLQRPPPVPIPETGTGSGTSRITPDAPTNGAHNTRHALAAVVWFAATLSFVAVTLYSLSNLYFNPAYFRDDYRGIARYLAALARPGDAIITIAPNQVEAFGYYHRAGAPIYPLPRARPLDPAATEAELADLAARHSRLFVLYWGDEQADPERRVEQWLNTHNFKAGETWYGQVRLATYAAAAPAGAPSTLSGAQFGEHLTLVGYHLPSAGLAPGDILQVTLFWRTDAVLPERYKVFVHLYADPNQPPVAQQDGEPGGGLRPTSEWPVGEVVADNHGVLIPPDLPPGTYTLNAGLYELFTNVRLPITLEGSPVGDRLNLGTVTIE